MHNKRIYVVSKFLKYRQGVGHFHFIGYFKGVYVRKILITGGDFIENEDYVLAIKDVVCHEEYLSGTLVKSKQLFI
ncbi:MAG: hypothetical protein HON90_14315 [Halobacteriovoraceae bacterium]|jgi:hypothetical protein|nr:hypothetical protein [Halobacteriovoraceae bacterium]